MLEHLPASIAVRPHAPVSAGMAALVHTALILGAVALTRQVPAAVVAPVRVDTIVLRPPAPTTTPAPLPDLTDAGESSIPALPTVVVATPTGLPGLDGAAVRTVEAAPAGGPAPGLFAGGDGIRGPIAASVPDEPPLWLAGPPLRYPENLRSAGLEGEVTIEVVIDPSGHPDPGTLMVVRASHPRFVDAAREAILGSRYRPGRLRGTPVPVVIRQVVRFTLR